jgi:hypothetical protein
MLETVLRIVIGPTDGHGLLHGRLQKRDIGATVEETPPIVYRDTH